MSTKFRNQGHAEDVIMRLWYLYYVESRPAMSDAEYDALAVAVKSQWSMSIVTHDIGSCCAHDYPDYVVEGRRPNAEERMVRDKRISKRWMDNL